MDPFLKEEPILYSDSFYENNFFCENGDNAHMMEVPQHYLPPTKSNIQISQNPLLLVSPQRNEFSSEQNQLQFDFLNTYDYTSDHNSQSFLRNSSGISESSPSSFACAEAAVPLSAFQVNGCSMSTTPNNTYDVNPPENALYNNQYLNDWNSLLPPSMQNQTGIDNMSSLFANNFAIHNSKTAAVLPTPSPTNFAMHNSKTTAVLPTPPTSSFSSSSALPTPPSSPESDFDLDNIIATYPDSLGFSDLTEIMKGLEPSRKINFFEIDPLSDCHPPSEISSPSKLGSGSWNDFANPIFDEEVEHLPETPYLSDEDGSNSPRHSNLGTPSPPSIDDRFTHYANIIDFEHDYCGLGPSESNAHIILPRPDSDSDDMPSNSARVKQQLKNAINDKNKQKRKVGRPPKCVNLSTAKSVPTVVAAAGMIQSRQTHGKPAAYTRRMREEHIEILKTAAAESKTTKVTNAMARKRRTAAGDPNDDQERRSNHNTMERSRRDYIKQGFQKLRNQVPDIKLNLRASKAMILTKAREHIVDLENQVANRMFEEEYMLKRHKELQKKLDSLQNKTASFY